MRINLSVPFKEKDEARRLEAKWDLARKTWYVVDIEDVQPFIRWMTPQQVNPSSHKQKKRQEQFYRMKHWGDGEQCRSTNRGARVPHKERKE
ncbi:DUF5710 domain-containing protein [Burkholderia multivorans]|uniref:DUF5710 domain-containing protein n=1 Tax=Burkholderia multivorans TaxID=87883 RepID=UPI00345EE8E5